MRMRIIGKLIRNVRIIYFPEIVKLIYAENTEGLPHMQQPSVYTPRPTKPAP